MAERPIAAEGGVKVDRSGPWAVGSVVMLVVVEVLLAGTFWRVAVFGPRYMTMFKEMGAKLPLPRQFCLSPYMLVALAVFGVLGGLNVVLVGNVKLRLVLSVVHLFAVLAALGVWVMSTFLPLIELMTKMEAH